MAFVLVVLFEILPGRDLNVTFPEYLLKGRSPVSLTSVISFLGCIFPLSIYFLTFYIEDYLDILLLSVLPPQNVNT